MHGAMGRSTKRMASILVVMLLTCLGSITMMHSILTSLETTNAAFFLNNPSNKVLSPPAHINRRKVKAMLKAAIQKKKIPPPKMGVKKY
jgi:hypothetical protein